MKVYLHKELWTLRAYHFAFVDLLLHGSLYNLKVDPRTTLHEPFGLQVQPELRQEMRYHIPTVHLLVKPRQLSQSNLHLDAMDEIGIEIQRNVGDTLFCSSH
jgi:hypothetical protein